jgi:hypothetical protein
VSAKVQYAYLLLANNNVFILFHNEIFKNFIARKSHNRPDLDYKTESELEVKIAENQSNNQENDYPQDVPHDSTISEENVDVTN